MSTNTLLLALCALLVGTTFGKLLPKHPRLDGRIVGGQDADISELPHQISLEYFGSHRCGGSVIAKNVVLTAAHCTDGISARDLQIRAGTTQVGRGGVVVDVKEVFVNEKYNPYNIDFDMSILILADDLPLSKTISPIGLPKLNEDIPSGTPVIVSGWGALSEGGWGSDVLQKVTVPIIDHDTCQDAYTGYDITPRMICAGILNVGGKDACQGDSGGPLVANNKIYGVVSWGIGCAEKRYPGVYTNVASLRDWIHEKAGL